MRAARQYLTRAIRSRRFLVSLIILLLATGLIVWVKDSLSGPAQGVVNSQVSASEVNNYKEPKTKAYKGTVLNFNYPGRYEITGSKLTGNFIEVVNLFATDHSEVSISIGVEQETLSQDSGIKYRKNNPDTYTPLPTGPGTISFQSTQSGYERDSFIQHGKYVVSASATAPSENAIGSDFTNIVNSFKWH